MAMTLVTVKYHLYHGKMHEVRHVIIMCCEILLHIVGVKTI